MPEVKNNFLKGRMNKDLDERLLQNGEYRDARNVSTSTSESGNSGSLESVLGNVETTDFGLTDNHLEIIGVYVDDESDRAYFFITNYTDSSSDQLSNFAYSASKHYIFMYDVRRGDYKKLVEGNFLNFSKTHPILAVGLLEDLMFWTDNRNQPRKINVETAIANSPSISSNPYYTKEEHVSVAKYYPWNPIRLFQFDPSGALNTYNHNLLGNITENFDTLSGGGDDGLNQLYDQAGSYSTPALTTSGSGTGLTLSVSIASDQITSIEVVDGGSGFQVGDTITIENPSGGVDEATVTLTEDSFNILPTMKDTTNKDLPCAEICDWTSLFGGTDNGTVTVQTSGLDLTTYEGCLVYITDSAGTENVSISDGVTATSITLSAGDIYNVTLSASVDFATGDTITFAANPDYDSSTDTLRADLKDRFVRFAYRFKFDDGEYSLISPFTQSVFIPKQDGHFLGNGDNIDADEIKAYKSSIVSFFQNKVTKATLVIDLPEGITQAGDLLTDLKVEEIEILYKSSNEPSIKVVDTITSDDLSGSTDTEITYEYVSNSPTKVLPERETTRVYDKVPVRAKAQEIIGNRVVYGNYVPELPYESELDFSVSAGDKDYQYQSIDAYSRREYPSHTLKQNRTYQVGVVLCDKFGRQSDVITSPTSTIKHSFRNPDDPLIDTDDLYMGDALKVTFNEPIPETSSIVGYKGIYNENTNPLGWYSYKIVVKQEEIDYFTCYTPSILNGYPVSSSGVTTRNKDLAHVTIIADNIDKIPRDFTMSNENDNTFRADVQLYPRVSADEYAAGEHRTFQYGNGNVRDSVIAIGDRLSLGLNTTEDGTAFNSGGGGYNQSPFYTIPTNVTEGSNPLIGRISTSEPLGVLGGNSSDANYISFTKQNLNVLETVPKKSNIDIYWETSSAGLISELNSDILNGNAFDGVPYQIDAFGWSLSEASAVNDIVTNTFTIQDFDGNDILNANTTGEIISVKARGFDYTSFNMFQLNKDGGSFKYSIKLINPTNQLVFIGGVSNFDVDFKLRFTNLVNGETVSNDIDVNNNKLINVVPSLGEQATDFGALDQSLDSQNRLIIRGDSFNGKEVVTGWREISDLTFSNGSIYEPLVGLSFEVSSIKYFNTNLGDWYEYLEDPYIISQTYRTSQGSPFARNNWRQFVRIHGDENASPSTLKVYYSPLLQSVNTASTSSDPWFGVSNPVYMGRWYFSTNSDRFAQFNDVDPLDANAGKNNNESARTVYADINRYNNGVVATDFRVYFNVYDAYGNGLSQEQYVEFTLNTDIFY